MTPLATVASMETRLGLNPGDLTGADLQRASDALDDASVEVRAEAGLDFLEADGVTLDAPLVIVKIARDVALRQYRNPDGYVSEGMGGGAYTYRYADEEASAALTPGEIRQIRAAVRTLKGGGFQGTVPTPAAFVNDLPAYEVDVNGIPFP